MTQTPTKTPTQTPTPTKTTTTQGYCYTSTYQNATPLPSELYIRYNNSSNVAVTVSMTTGLPAIDNEDGTNTTFVCQYSNVAPLCVTDNGVDPPIVVNCGIVYGITWLTQFDTCTSNFNCVPIIPT